MSRSTQTMYEQRREYIKHMLLSNYTQQDIGNEFGFSGERARAIINKLGLSHLLRKNRRRLINLTKHHSASELGLKYCHVCKIAKPFAEMNQNKQSKDGCIGRCKACSAALNAVRYHDESSGFKAVTLQWQRDNPDKVKAYSKRWYEKMKALLEVK